MGNQTFARDNNGKISHKILSQYGRQQLNLLEGVKYKFPNGDIVKVENGLIVINNKTVDENGKTFQTDYSVNKIIYLIM